MRAGLFATIAMSALLVTAGCGGESAAEEAPDLSAAFFDSDYVKNYEVSEGTTIADVIAHAAAYGDPPEEVLAQVFSASNCLDVPCALSDAAQEAADAVGAEEPAEVYKRLILVQYEDDWMEFITVYVADPSDEEPVLVDSNGETYDDLADFQDHNDLLESGDWILASEQITATPGEGGLVTVSGKTGSGAIPWVVGGLAAAAVLVVVAVVRHR